MSPLSAFPVTRKWPPLHPEYLPLYALATPHGYETLQWLMFRMGRALAAFVARPAVQAGLLIPKASV